MGNASTTSLINLKTDRPSTEVAIKKLKMELMTLRRIGVTRVKIIHGYGSTGQGGSIRNAVRAELLEMARDNRIKAFCPGELFGPFEKPGRHLLEIDAAFRNDSDWARSNDGVTLVSL